MLETGTGSTLDKGGSGGGREDLKSLETRVVRSRHCRSDPRHRLNLCTCRIYDHLHIVVRVGRVRKGETKVTSLCRKRRGIRPSLQEFTGTSYKYRLWRSQGRG